MYTLDVFYFVFKLKTLYLWFSEDASWGAK